MKLFEKTNLPLLKTMLDACSARNKVIATNISNINTVGYKAKRLAFEEELGKAMVESNASNLLRTNARHLENPESSASNLIRVVDNAEGGDEFASGVNNVDIDLEMSELAKNQIKFKFAAKLLGEGFKGIQKSIRGHA